MFPETSDSPGPPETTTAEERAAAEAARVGELFLLLRLVLADGEAGARAVDALRRVAAAAWGLDDREIDRLLEQALAFGTTIATAQTVATFRGLGLEHRRMLAADLSVIASRDAELKRHQDAFRARLLEILDLRPEGRPEMM